MTNNFHQTSEVNGSSYVKILIRRSTILNTESDEKFCFLWSVLAHPRPSKCCHAKKVYQIVGSFSKK